jgi:hypothetical protein
MAFLVFAQSKDGTFPALLAAQHGRTHFDLVVTPATDDGGTTLAVATDAGQSAEGLCTTLGKYRVTVRPVTEIDLGRAREAALRGRAAGMDDLAARCGFVWLVEPVGAPPEWLTWECCALLAFVALGPILPPDGSSLLGVRSARERAARISPRTA